MLFSCCNIVVKLVARKTKHGNHTSLVFVGYSIRLVPMQVGSNLLTAAAALLAACFEVLLPRLWSGLEYFTV